MCDMNRTSHVTHTPFGPYCTCNHEPRVMPHIWPKSRPRISRGRVNRMTESRPDVTSHTAFPGVTSHTNLLSRVAVRATSHVCGLSSHMRKSLVTQVSSHMWSHARGVTQMCRHICVVTYLESRIWKTS